MSPTAGQVIKCKAAVAWKANTPLDVCEVEVAAPKAGEVRVKVLSNALCHTDIYTLDGHDPEGLFPCILGHEASAIVESVGEGVTSVKEGDWVIPCYTPQCKEASCVFCESENTNLCPKIRAYQGAGVMADGTSRFSKDGKPIFHFMGCSTFAEYTVLAEISCAKVSPMSNPKETCLLGCGVATGWGAVENNAKVTPGSSVAIFGIGALGLSCIQKAKQIGAARIVAVDINEGKFKLAKELGATECIVSTESIKDDLMKLEKWGFDFTFDCTGNVNVMRTALEVAARGWGMSCVIGVAPAGKEIATRPFQLVTGRRWIGTAFGGWKSRDEVPRLVQETMRQEIDLKPYVTHEFTGIDSVNDSIKALHSGDCLRAVVHIAEATEQCVAKAATDLSCNTFKMVDKQKVNGGYLARYTHKSPSIGSDMTFSVFMPPKAKRSTPPPPVLVFLGGITCTDENARTKSNVYAAAAKYGYCVVFPDTSPRNEVAAPSELGEEGWMCGPGASFYVDATKAPFKETYQMETYLTKELPQLLTDYFDVDTNRMSITGFSMGGHGAISLHLKHPELYKSVSAFAPITTLSDDTKFAAAGDYLFAGGKSEAQAHEVVTLLKEKPSQATILVDQGSSDAFLNTHINWNALKAVRADSPQKMQMNYQTGYGHNWFFVSSFVEKHVEHHAAAIGQPVQM